MNKRVSLFPIVIAILFLACKSSSEKTESWNIKGSWYTFFEGDGGLYDSILTYTEYYINDSVISTQEEIMGQHSPWRYFIKNDSIYLCNNIGKGYKFEPMYKIEKLENDTIWLSIDPKWVKKNHRTHWIRFPKDEKGEFDHIYDEKNSDSLSWAIVFDWERRRDKNFAKLSGTTRIYDSLLNAGRYRWSMQLPSIQESFERRKKAR